MLLAAEGGLLDRDYAERLLNLSFYPVGSAVEMADGSLALVAAAPSASPNDLNAQLGRWSPSSSTPTARACRRRGTST